MEEGRKVRRRGRQEGQEKRKAVIERINRGWRKAERSGKEEGSRRKDKQRMEEGRKVRRRGRQEG